MAATVWQGGAGKQPPGALPRLLDCTDASPPSAEMRSALEGLYRASGEYRLRHSILKASDHEAQLCNRTVALVADAAQRLTPHAMILRREGW